MYRGFNITGLGEGFGIKYETKGQQIQGPIKEKLKDSFVRFIINEDNLDASFIMDTWFPAETYDIFLSHSYKDIKLALSVAGKLWEDHGLKVFVDSGVWLNSEDLLKIIDNRYCRSTESGLYNYKERNHSTAHVHMMLINSLNNVIDNSEAIFFLNTPNSISASDTIQQRTFSPWIFSEIEATKLIKKKTPKRFERNTRLFSEYENNYVALNESTNEMRISYEADLGHLTTLSEREFIEWISHNYSTSNDALNKLYKKNWLKKAKIIGL